MILRAFLPQEEDDFQNAEEELELDQSSELYKTIVAAIIKEEEDGDNQEGGKDDSGMVGDAAGDQTQDGLPPLLRRQLHQAVKHHLLARCVFVC